jgi:release factor glutamine methyltransferase
MRSDEWLAGNTRKLSEAGIASARLDCLILLEDATGKDRSWLLAHPEHVLDDAVVAQLDEKVARRVTHVPLAYIRQRTEFYGRTFFVDERVLEPRPESETMISLLKTLPLTEHPKIADVGTGSGALAISAKLELPAAFVYATDIDPACLAVARKNAEDLRADVKFFEADLLRVVSGTPQATPDAILANLPYVPDEWHINQAAMSEPRIAIFGGPDGLDLYRRLFWYIQEKSIPITYVLTEALPPQHEALAAITTEAGFRLAEQQDFIQVFERLIR